MVENCQSQVLLPMVPHRRHRSLRGPVLSVPQVVGRRTHEFPSTSGPLHKLLGLPKIAPVRIVMNSWASPQLLTTRHVHQTRLLRAAPHQDLRRECALTCGNSQKFPSPSQSRDCDTYKNCTSRKGSGRSLTSSLRYSREGREAALSEAVPAFKLSQKKGPVLSSDQSPWRDQV